MMMWKRQSCEDQQEDTRREHILQQLTTTCQVLKVIKMSEINTVKGECL